MDAPVFIVFCLVALSMILKVQADTPANCSYNDIKGTWTFSMGPGGNDRTVKCNSFTGKSTYKVTLKYPNIAIDQDGVKGTWTMVYNQGFEVIVAGKKYFGFSKNEGGEFWCDKIESGWSHDFKDSNWACYNGQKTSNSSSQTKPSKRSELKFETEVNPNSDELVEAINSAGLSWTAAKYPQFEGMKREDFVRMAGGKYRQGGSPPKPAPLTQEDLAVMEALPKSFDWRDIKGVNYVSPVRDQGVCGSCYAFASMAMIEARARIATKNKEQPVFSPQDVVDCSEYSQGCNGGFNYLIAGKYAEDFGVVLEKCNPYQGMDHRKCLTKPTCARQYATNYTYIGGYYGACNEPRMMKAVYENGPIAVSFEVYNDFSSYKQGIYHHKFELRGVRFDPFELTNHAVLVVGWGENEKGQKYWIVKNSWSEDWGNQGYFWISKGNDECAIESMAVESFPIYNTADFN